MSASQGDSRLLRAAHVARVLGVHRATVARWWRARELPRFVVAGRSYMTGAMLRAWVTERESTSGTGTRAAALRLVR